MLIHALIIPTLLSLVAAQFTPSAAASTPDARLEAGLAEITPARIRAQMGFLADDLLEGRAPGSRGGTLAAKYIASQFEALGLEPANHGSYFQDTSIIGATPSHDLKLEITRSSSASGRSLSQSDPLALSYGSQFVAWSDTQQPETKVDGELVFAGYGIAAPEWNWDDFKGIDLHGKIILVLVNDPPSPKGEDDPSFFEGKAMTYYGRWTYKLEEATRRGALGAIVIHQKATAGYGWEVVQNSTAGDHFALELAPGTNALKLAAWIPEDSARKIAAAAGQKFEDWLAQAGRRDFKPIDLGLRLKTVIHSRIQKIQSPNVVAIRPGTDPKLKHEYVLYCGHYDHFGLVENGPAGKPEIYNGAVDNASGVSSILSIAAAFANAPTDRSVIFFIPTGEEAGLLGSEYYVRHPLRPLAKTVAVINLDEVNVFGKTKDADALGMDRSTMRQAILAAGRAMHMKIGGELFPERGTYFRSDHFSFARMAVPSISLEFGREFLGPGAKAALARSEEYSAKRYHRPADKMRDDMDFSAAVQHASLAYRIGFALAGPGPAPQWLPGHEVPKAARF